MAQPVDKRPRTIRDTVESIGLKQPPLSDVYHHLLTISWGRLLLSLLVVYVGINALFALLYLLDPDAIEGAGVRSFLDSFFFSVQTMATIGYGKMVPHSVYANALVTVEALVGMLSTAMATGLMFAKFSRPTARVVFSRVLTMAVRDGVQSLTLRVANERGNQVVEANMRLVMLRSEVTREGETIRRIIDLKLVRPSTAVFVLSWTAVHQITPDSPLYGLSTEQLKAMNATFMVTIVGIDETFAQQVHARYTYFADEIVWNHRFVDIMSPLPNGKLQIDYSKFHDTMPMAAEHHV